MHQSTEKIKFYYSRKQEVKKKPNRAARKRASEKKGHGVSGVTFGKL